MKSQLQSKIQKIIKNFLLDNFCQQQKYAMLYGQDIHICGLIAEKQVVRCSFLFSYLLLLVNIQQLKHQNNVWNLPHRVWRILELEKHIFVKIVHSNKAP